MLIVRHRERGLLSLIENPKKKNINVSLLNNIRSSFHVCYFAFLVVQTKPTAKTLLDPKRAQNLGKIMFLC